MQAGEQEASTHERNASNKLSERAAQQSKRARKQAYKQAHKQHFAKMEDCEVGKESRCSNDVEEETHSQSLHIIFQYQIGKHLRMQNSCVSRRYCNMFAVVVFNEYMCVWRAGGSGRGGSGSGEAVGGEMGR